MFLFLIQIKFARPRPEIENARDTNYTAARADFVEFYSGSTILVLKSTI